jgi:aryl-alcohol dehydrogenase-like predicted oxidoreductase
MRTRPFGKTGIPVSALGYGAPYLSVHGRPSEQEAIRLVQKAVTHGVTLIDTADTYCLGPSDLHHNERLLMRAIHGQADGPRDLLIATKGGALRTAQGWELDGRPERLYQAICGSHAALGGDAPIPLWQHHWPDPRYSIRAMLAPVQRAVEQGLVRLVGVANYTVEQLQQAREMLDVVSVQNQYNLWHREAEQDGMLEYCEREGLVFLPWRPMGGPGLAHRLAEIEPLARIARDRGISPQRLMMAWHLAKSPCIIPIVGTRQWDHLKDCLAADDVKLEPREMAQLDAIQPGQLAERSREPAWEGMPPLAE